MFWREREREWWCDRNLATDVQQCCTNMERDQPALPTSVVDLDGILFALKDLKVS